MRESMWKTSGIYLLPTELSGPLCVCIWFVYHKKIKNCRQNCAICGHSLREFWQSEGTTRACAHHCEYRGKMAINDSPWSAKVELQYSAAGKSTQITYKSHANQLVSQQLLTIATLALMLAVRTMIEFVIDLSSVFAAKTEITSNLL